ncbi:LLM class flavin-dependent oxidoreductase [Streptomyces sp. NEAU-174]|uniref:LLM class flavin-dependent oxidoreductase n=1 Tax=Streptomyces sp. NEAU-174 TaxID=3458254 RepID=UPI0040450ADB
MADRMNFGIFLTPFHLPNTQNPTWALRRDVELVKHYDMLGFDEVWFGEHHSCGCELIGDPITMIAHCAPQTRHIKLGTGVFSLPYHNPLWAAERMIFVDHLTRGRAMYGLGPGALPTDARMVGIEPSEQRDAFELDVDVLMHLIHSDEPISVKTGRYTLNDAMVQLKPYSDLEVAVAAVVSPSGPRIAGKHGLSLMSIAATMQGGTDALAGHRRIVEERAREFGAPAAPRSTWRLLGPMHIAETREQAVEDVRHGIDLWFDYMQNVSASPQFSPAGTTTEERIRWVVDSGVGVIGTPDDAIEQIRRLQEMSDGGFGTYLIMGNEWARFDATKRSCELFAEHVMPVFQNQNARLRASERWARGHHDDLHARQAAALRAASDKHAAEQEAKSVATD